jgi:thiamine biosynthesis lipoprotein
MTRRITLVLFLALLGSCTPSRSVTHFRGATMGTSYSIKVVLLQDGDRNRARTAIDTTLAEFDLLFSTYNKNSEISRFNAYQGPTPFLASQPFADLVRRALKLAERTGGAFDPTVGPLARLYGFGPGAKDPRVPPTKAAIAVVREVTGWQRLKMEGLQISKQPSKVELDLNAIAKGAGVDAVSRTLDELGSSSYMVEIGGEVRCRGSKPDGVLWRLGISQPGGTGFADKVDLRNAAMATSGSYLQFKQLGSTKVHHILDPRTGQNSDSKVVSVTVIAPSCALADGLATALMVLGPDRGEKVLAASDLRSVRVLYLLSGDSGIEQRSVRW